MGRGLLTRDHIGSATSTCMVTWSEGLESNKAHRVLHYPLCRLSEEGRGQLVNAGLTLAQTTLAKKLGISRQWVGKLVSRREQAGWIAHHSSKLADGTNDSSRWRVGRLLKRLLVMLAKSRHGKKQRKDTAACHWHFSPQRGEREILSILERENESPTLEVLARIPTLKQWLQRGQE